jgi:hypothetical protein
VLRVSQQRQMNSAVNVVLQRDVEVRQILDRDPRQQDIEVEFVW